jgi:HK97 family phage prohead protease
MTKPLERRMSVTGLQIRDAESGQPEISGYASTFNQPYDMGWYTESIDPGAFARTLGARPDVRLLINHDGLPLARTTSGTLALDTDSKGLRVAATLDPTDPDVAAIVPKMRRGDLSQMSFAFRVSAGGDAWSKDLSQRTMLALDLNNGDVSVVTYPANPNAAVALRAGGSGAEAVTSLMATLELRNASDDEVAEVLARALAHFRPAARSAVADAVTAAAVAEPTIDPEAAARRAAHMRRVTALAGLAR